MTNQRFDENYLLPIAKEIGLNPTKTSKLIALRNAWISYFHGSKVSQTLDNKIQILITDEVAADYIVLTSEKWLEHPWMGRHPWMYQEQGEDFVSLKEAWDHKQWQDWQETQEDDGINSSINDFLNQKQKKTYTSLFEKNADYAAHDIKLAKNRIQELHAEINEQEGIINVAMKAIRKLQNQKMTVKTRSPGRPKISEMKDQQQRREVAMEFVAQWIGSLMSTLSITTCGDLAKMVRGQKMTWWRWLNKETLPSQGSLESLLNVKIKSGELQGKNLREIQTSPPLNRLITLVNLV